MHAHLTTVLARGLWRSYPSEGTLNCRHVVEAAQKAVARDKAWLAYGVFFALGVGLKSDSNMSPLW